MNIFITDQSIEFCVKSLDDKRLNKMIVETTQLLSNAIHHHINTIPDFISPPYKITHYNHPCSVWVRSNYKWTLSYWEALLSEYVYRFDKYHKCQNHYLDLHQASRYILNSPDFNPVNCSMFKTLADVYTAYKLTLLHKWKNDVRPVRFTRREPNIKTKQMRCTIEEKHNSNTSKTYLVYTIDKESINTYE